MFRREQKREVKKITLTPSEVYAAFGVPPGTLANLRWAKKGPRFFRMPGGRKIFYLASDVEEWITRYPVQTVDSIEDK